MELKELFERVHVLTGKYPHLKLEELKELRVLASSLQAECADGIYDWERDIAEDSRRNTEA